MLDPGEAKNAIIGPGYVELSLAVEFAKNLPVLGFDINNQRVEELKSGKDSTHEISSEELSYDLELISEPQKNQL